jgi:hypothetical protein
MPIYKWGGKQNIKTCKKKDYIKILQGIIDTYNLNGKNKNINRIATEIKL